MRHLFLNKARSHLCFSHFFSPSSTPQGNGIVFHVDFFELIFSGNTCFFFSAFLLFFFSSLINKGFVIHYTISLCTYLSIGREFVFLRLFFYIPVNCLFYETFLPCPPSPPLFCDLRILRLRRKGKDVHCKSRI